MEKELKKYQMAFLKTTEKTSLIYQKLKKEESVIKKAKELIET